MSDEPRRVDATAELGFVVAAPSPEVSLRSDGEGVVVTGGDAGNVSWKTRYRRGLVGIGSHDHNRGGQAQRAIATIPKAEYRAYPSPAKPN